MRPNDPTRFLNGQFVFLVHIVSKLQNYILSLAHVLGKNLNA